MTTATLQRAVRVPRGFRQRGAPWAFVDVLMLLLLVYMTQTEWIRTINNPEARELTLPPIDLTDMAEQGDAALSGESGGMMIVSIDQDGDKVVYHRDDDVLDWGGLSKVLLDVSPSEVVLRVDDDVRQGDVMKVMDLARDNGVLDISFAFTAEEGGS